jgi:hypothetical protein
MSMRELTPDQAEQVEEHLREAAARLPETVDLSRFYELLDGGMLQFAWEELRELAEARPTTFPFWVEMSKAGELLGHR